MVANDSPEVIVKLQLFGVATEERQKSAGALKWHHVQQCGTLIGDPQCSTLLPILMGINALATVTLFGSFLV